MTIRGPQDVLGGGMAAKQGSPEDLEAQRVRRIAADPGVIAEGMQDLTRPARGECEAGGVIRAFPDPQARGHGFERISRTSVKPGGAHFKWDPERAIVPESTAGALSGFK